MNKFLKDVSVFDVVLVDDSIHAEIKLKGVQVSICNAVTRDKYGDLQPDGGPVTSLPLNPELADMIIDEAIASLNHPVASNISKPKVDIAKQNQQAEAWIKANPKKVQYLAQGESTDKKKNRWMR